MTSSSLRSFGGWVDGTGEVALEAAKRLTAALAFGLLALEVGMRARVNARLGDREPVESAVELTVAVAVQPMPLSRARGRGQRRRACLLGPV